MQSTNGNEPENYPLDEDAIRLIAELDEQGRSAQVAVSASVSAVLSYFVRKHKLSGDWKLAQNRRELVSVPAQGPVVEPRRP